MLQHLSTSSIQLSQTTSPYLRFIVTCSISSKISMNPSFVSHSSPHNKLNTISDHNQLDLLFEKALTPSDVGKLNRLVIPKQYAEKYFPIRSACDRSSSSISISSSESMLSFEDEVGKIWRFRYSYWTSSQSYVLTKGWSRYVKEKGLTAGDIVSFQRQQCNKTDLTDRLFIAWRTGDNWSRTAAFFRAPEPKFKGENQKVAISSTPRRLRLFGVNMEYIDSESSNVSTDVFKVANSGASYNQA